MLTLDINTVCANTVLASRLVSESFNQRATCASYVLCQKIKPSFALIS